MQGRAGEWEDKVQLVDDADARDCAAAERAFICTLGGGCFAPVAAYAEVQDDTLHLRGLYVSADETHMARGAVTGRRAEATALGRTLALQLKHQAEENV